MATSVLSADPEHNIKLLRELMYLYLYGLMGERISLTKDVGKEMIWLVMRSLLRN